jgi:hypothetical protein
VNFKVELDLTGDGEWVTWKTVGVAAGQEWREALSVEVQARWLRVTSDRDAEATARIEH